MQRKKLRKALERYSFLDARKALGIDDPTTSEDIKYLVDTIIQTGCLIPKNASVRDKFEHNAFIAAVVEHVKTYGNADESSKLSTHLLQVPLLGEAYEQILNLLGQSSISDCSPAEQIWAAIISTEPRRILKP